jgi:hypothetical protein
MTSTKTLSFRKILLPAALFIFCFIRSDAQYEWLQTYGGSTGEGASAMKLDVHGNIFTTGVFNSTMDIDPGPSVYNVTPTGNSSMYILKLDTGGNFLWVKQVNLSSGNIDCSAITFDNSGNILLTGYLNGSGDFNPGAGQYFMSTTSQDVFILKLDSIGNFLWAGRFSGLAGEFGNDIICDSQDNVIIAGKFSDVADFDFNGTYIATSAGNTDLFICKLGPAGNFIWVKTIGGPGYETANAVDLDANGNMYVAGTFQGTVDFDPDIGINNLSVPGSSFVLKLDQNGNFLWARNFGGVSNANKMQVDIAGNIYTAGIVIDSGDFDPGPNVYNLFCSHFGNVYLSKLDGNGNFLWAELASEGSSTSLPWGLDVDSQNGICLTGTYYGTSDFDPGAAIYLMTSHGNQDIFVSHLDNNGNFLWADAIGGLMPEEAKAVAFGPGGSLYAFGAFRDSAVFGVASSDYIPSNGSYDIFLIKYAAHIIDNTAKISGAELFIYPNPAVSNLQIHSRELLPSMNVSMTNISGEEILKKEYSFVTTVFLDLDCAPGIYFLRIRYSGKEECYKIFKQ